MPSKPLSPTLQCPCERRVGGVSFSYNTPPEGETRFDIGNASYRRCYWRCGICSHEFSDHDIDLSGLYAGSYVEQTYGDEMRATFDRILALPEGQSDNSGRVQRVLEFGAKHFPSGFAPNLLDIGAGLGVFPFRMKQEGWDTTALDPDPQVGRHLEEVVGVRAVTLDFFDAQPNLLGQFDVITLNKVIEHVENPVLMLAKASDFLNPNGFLYIEVPDVAAGACGPEREEFFIEHHHVFSPASLTMTVERAGLKVIQTERLIEPSGKYTVAIFATG